MKKSVGIIGFGRFGKLTADILKDHFHIFVYDKNPDMFSENDMDISFVDIETCASKDIIILAVPISSFETVVKQIVPFLKQGSLVVDVCSVKEVPVSIMNSFIPSYCDCIGTHPLFGPDTFHSSINKKIVVCPIRDTNIKKIESFLKNLSLTPLILSAQEHDKHMATSLALIHLLGRALDGIGVHRTNIATPTHTRFIDLIDIVRNDSNQLFMDMHTYNRFTKNMRTQLIDELIRLDGELDG